ncbi:MAG: hypothetical protein IJA32_01375 [Lachnospiraceae bacterium]|nr:hypothetical protein [Lachnospiraceae bacterium]
MRRLFKQETVLTIIMITVTTILIIGATVAWFLGNRPVTIKNYFQQAGGIDDLSVEMAIISEDASEDVTYYTMNAINTGNKVIDIDLAKLTNIEEGKLGPGSYGTIKFKISTSSEADMNYIIRITPSITVVDGVEDISNEELLDLVQNHIKFYAVKDTTVAESEPTNVYQKVIPYYFDSTIENDSEDTSGDDLGANNEADSETTITSGLTGTVSNAEIEYVTLYWYWPYEYTDIPGYDITDYNSSIYNPWSTSTEENVDVIVYEGRYSSSLSEDERIEAYDWDDTKIGNYVSALNFHFEVSTYQ